LFRIAAMPTYKLSYFPITGLGEPIRATFALAGIPFEDERLPGDEWGKRKVDATSPFFGQQMPALVITDDAGGAAAPMFQSRAILRYVGTIGKYNGKSLYPDDPMERYNCDEVIEMVEDFRPHMAPTFAIQDQAEKEKARFDLVQPEGKMYPGLEKLNKRLGKFSFAAGESPSVADLYVVTVCYLLQQPTFLDGFPADTFKAFPNISALKDRLMALPPLVAYYKDADGIRAAFKVA